MTVDFRHDEKKGPNATAKRTLLLSLCHLFEYVLYELLNGLVKLQHMN